MVLLLASHFYNLQIQMRPLLGIIVVLALVNFWTWRRLQQGGSIPDGEFFLQLNSRYGGPFTESLYPADGGIYTMLPNGVSKQG